MDVKMKEELRENIFNVKFNQVKCHEIGLKIIELFNDNNCNPTERLFILSMIQTIESSKAVINLIRNNRGGSPI